MRVNINRRGKQADREYKFSLRDGIDVGRDDRDFYSMQSPARHEVSQPADDPHQKVALAEGAKNQKACGHNGKSGRFLRHQSGHAEAIEGVPRA